MIRNQENNIKLKTEVFSMQFGFGNYFGAINFGFLTLRKSAFYWEILHMRATGFFTKGHMEFGTLGGAVLYSNEKYELRSGLGAVLSMYFDDKQHWTGFGVTPQFSFLFGRSEKMAWEVTAALHVPLGGKQGVDKGYESLLDHPIGTPPVFTLCIGFRI